MFCGGKWIGGFAIGTALLVLAGTISAQPSSRSPGGSRIMADGDRDRDRSDSNWDGDRGRLDFDQDRGEGDRSRRDAEQGPRRVRPSPREEGTPEGVAPEAMIAPGQPHTRIAPPIAGWKLGVYAFNTPAGVRITRVQPGSAAARAGLEPGDVVVTVNGYQIGQVGSRLYPLGDELQRRAGPRGEVFLLVQNVRNRDLVNMNVRLQRQF